MMHVVSCMPCWAMVKAFSTTALQQSKKVGAVILDMNFNAHLGKPEGGSSTTRMWFGRGRCVPDSIKLIAVYACVSA